jgi:fumarylacetoacetate (FAA) hydrolase family protein
MAYFDKGTFVGRAWETGGDGPILITVRDGMLFDITSRAAPTMRDLMEMDDPSAFTRQATGRMIAPLAAIDAGGGEGGLSLLSPADLQAIKACGVTFARSMLERVIEEKAGGDPHKAEAVRSMIGDAIGVDLAAIAPGSPEAERLKAALQSEGLWSQYLEVGLGPDAEVFTKAQPMSAVGHGADIGVHPASSWNNPEPEVVLAVDSRGRIKGATLGNDVNLRDVEGRSALLLGKAKDNNASCAIGPFIRLFDETFTLDDVRACELSLTIEGEDCFVLEGKSSMREISRDPENLVAQTIGPHHQYPDGLMLFLGTMFAPVKDRDALGKGFTHKTGDRVRISTDTLGSLRNRVKFSADCPPWTFGTGDLMRNLARRGLL